MDENKVDDSRTWLLAKLYPRLLPTAVALLLLLVFTAAERVRRTTPEGKFNRIQMGMDRRIVRDMLGPAPFTDRYYEWWNLDGLRIEVYFNSDGKVWGKHMHDGTGDWFVPRSLSPPSD